MNQLEILERARALGPWHHNFEIVSGVMAHSLNDPNNPEHTMSAVDPHRVAGIFNKYYPNGLHGKDVLDVGCNAGGYCFVAAELGARSITGIEARQHWLNQAEFIHNLRYSNIQNVRFVRTDVKSYVSDLTSADLTLFQGIFYHLPDPIGVLLRIAEITKEFIVVNTLTKDTIPEDCLAVRMESTTRPLSGLDGLAWVPGGPAAVRAILRQAGFRHFDTLFWAHNLKDGMGRMEIAARR